METIAIELIKQLEALLLQQLDGKVLALLLAKLLGLVEQGLDVADAHASGLLKALADSAVPALKADLEAVRACLEKCAS